MNFSTLLLGLTAIATALIAGLFYAYSCSVNPGLGKLGDAAYVSAMQAINRAILNPLFFCSFLGTLLLLPLSTVLNYDSFTSPRFLLLAGATLMYVTGTFGVTVGGNVPLNETLDAVDLAHASAEELRAARTAFEASWNRLHGIRTVAAVIALVLVVMACLVPRATN